MGEGLVQPRSRDAVVVVPGIMGSELVDAETGRTLWGLADPRWYVSAWTSGASLGALRLSEDERAGRYGRVRASRLLRFPAFAPLLAGFAPYTALLKGVRSVVCHPDAVREFAYDWRLPVARNGSLLADFARRHLAAWRAHPEQDAARWADPDGDRPARLVLVAHSMGGLLARHACLSPELAEDVRATVTLGTPFFGAPKAVLLLASGRGLPVPLPRARVRELASGLPGLHDLLPFYRCVGDGSGARRLTASDISGAGGDGELAAASFAWQETLSAVRLPGHVQVVGVHQPTVQAVTFDGDTVTGHRYTYRPSAAGVQQVDVGGDGTVPRESAQLPERAAMPLAQSHGAVASDSDAILIVQDVLTDRRTGPWQGAGDLGLDVPDLVDAGQPYAVTITGAERPIDVTCSVIDVGTGLRVDTPPVGREDGALVARAQPLRPGLYWVRIDGGGASPVTQIVMTIEPGDSGLAGAPS
jgi:hypothetical protein